MEWMFELNGDIEFLEELTKYFTSNKVFIFRNENNRYFLKSSYFQNLNYDYEVRNKAENMVKSINGAAEFILYKKKPIRIHQDIKINNDGSKSFSFSIPGYIDVIPKMEKSVINERKKLLKEWVNNSVEDDKIAILFEHICSNSNKWHLLYKRLELVINDLGSETKLTNKKWVSKNKIELFKRTANSYKAIGIESRHYNNEIPPKKPMTYPDAKKLIDKINLEWLKGRNK